MKDYLTKDIRNVAIVGHASSGKTALSEAMLFSAGLTTRIGTIAEGNTKSDYRPEEIERQCSVGTSVLAIEWQDTKLNILDTPGFSDFVGDALSAVRVADTGLIVVDSTNGPEMGTENMWSFCQEHHIPRTFVITGLDKEHSDFHKSFNQLKEAYGNHVTALQLPVNEGVGFHKIVDIIRRKTLVFNDDSGKFSMEDLPADIADEVESMYTELVEQVAESDEALMEKYFDQGELSEDDLRHGLREAIIHKQIFPVFCTASIGNIGASRLLELIQKYFPSPADMPAAVAVDGTKLHADDVNETAALIFKTTSEAHVGELSFFRVYAGQITSGMDLANPNRSGSERLGHVYAVNGHDRDEVHAINAGDIGATVKLKISHTGDTLSHPKNAVTLKATDFPLPNIQFAIVAKAKGEEDKISTGLALLHEEDPTLLYDVDSELHQTVLSGQGELQINVAFNKLQERFKVQVELVEPKIAYRETIKAKGEARYRHKKQSGGAGQFAEVMLRVEPLKRGSGIVFEETLVGQNVDRVFVPSVEKGIKSASEDGFVAGFPIVDVKATFYDGKMHPVDSKDIAFQIAGKGAFRDACKNSKPCLLEPVFEVEVRVPEEYMGDVMGDLTSKRGRILGMDADGHYQVLKAKVPHANLFKYASTLRSLTQGKASHKQKFSHYTEMPKEDEKKLVAALEAAKEDE
ncbi:MAG: elongation factor G [Candidatus Marinimicrobia bacterium]|nr:elongation factor G [Candidatus Neomarinimicrobiota bacterium]